ncbi:MAG: hypothetical protein FJ191_03040 [Gammaproteobacteria bacterium]|nr:hypothetical protein [Gammaproteobacteria bacterium]
MGGAIKGEREVAEFMDAVRVMGIVTGLTVLISMLAAGVIHVVFAAIRRLHTPAGGAAGKGE